MSEKNHKKRANNKGKFIEFVEFIDIFRITDWWGKERERDVETGNIKLKAWIARNQSTYFDFNNKTNKNLNQEKRKEDTKFFQLYWHSLEWWCTELSPFNLESELGMLGLWHCLFNSSRSHINNRNHQKKCTTFWFFTIQICLLFRFLCVHRVEGNRTPLQVPSSSSFLEHLPSGLIVILFFFFFLCCWDKIS